MLNYDKKSIKLKFTIKFKKSKINKKSPENLIKKRFHL